MNRLLLPLLIPLAIVAALLATLPPTPAAGQCTYTAVWTFDTDLAEWDIDPATWTGNSGNAAPGALYLPYVWDVPGGTTHTMITLSVSDIALAMGLPASAEISTTGVTVAAATANANSDGQQSHIHLVRQSGGADSAYSLPSQQWSILQITAAPGYLINEIWLVAFAGDVLFDDIEIVVPCSSVTAPDPDITPTPTITPTVAPTPTPMRTYTETLGAMLPTSAITAGVQIEPLPLDPIEDTIDLAPFWDVQTFRKMGQIIVTYFYLQNIPEFFKVFFWIAGILIGLRAMFAVISNRAAANRQQQQQTGRRRV